MNHRAKLTLGSSPRERLMSSGGGSGLYAATILTEQQRPRPVMLQDIRRSVDRITWEKLLSYARQLHTNCGEVRGPVLEKADLANSGGWTPRHVGKNTPKAVNDRYSEWLWNWMKVSDIRGQPYDFPTCMALASLQLDRDGEPPVIFTVNRNGDPRLQWIENHRIKSTPYSNGIVPDGEFKGRRIYHGVIYDEQSAPIAYRVVDEDNQFGQAITYRDIRVQNMLVIYEPEWAAQGRGVTSYAHGILKIFDMDDINAYLLIGVKHDATLKILEHTEQGYIDQTEERLNPGTNALGQGITLESKMAGEALYVRSNSGAKIQIPFSERPSPNVPEYLETILRGVYQGMKWPYEFTRSGEKDGGANARVTVEKVNRAVQSRYDTLEKIAVRACAYALGTAVNRRELPPGEWWAVDFPRPPLLTPDRWRQYQEDRENLKMGLTTKFDISSRNAGHWVDDDEQRDIEADALFTRCEAHSAKHSWLSPREVLEVLEQRSPNPSVQIEPDETGAGGAGAKTTGAKK